MNSLPRFDFAAESQARAKTAETAGDRFGGLIETATRWAHTAGRGLGISRDWIESEAIEHRPLATLGIAFGLGVFTGWLIKRR